jgi:hypothetical protein
MLAQGTNDYVELVCWRDTAAEKLQRWAELAGHCGAFDRAMRYIGLEPRPKFAEDPHIVATIPAVVPGAVEPPDLDPYPTHTPLRGDMVDPMRYERVRYERALLDRLRPEARSQP